MNLELIQDQIRACQACHLFKKLPQGCTPVPGEGKTGGFMFVGESPEEIDVELNQPFISMAGKLLDQILTKAGTKRSEVYIANTVNCLTKERLSAKDIKACKGWLWEQIKLVQPTHIFTMGSTPTKTLLRKIVKSTDKMKDIVGKEYSVGYCSAKIIPIYHPSFLLQYGKRYTEETIDIIRGINEL
jgi:uracil-DNA glycosylase family 4